MAEFSDRLQSSVDNFRARIVADTTILDPPEVHHEFADGGHGRKLDFDKIEEGSDFYIDWVSLYARAILYLHSHQMPDALVGVANGTNRLSRDISGLLGRSVIGLTTKKIAKNTVRLNPGSKAVIEAGTVNSALIVEDVSTTGSTAASVAMELKGLGVQTIKAISTWQRSPTLPRLQELSVPYESLIHKDLTTFSPEECLTNPEGFCARGIRLIAHKDNQLHIPANPVGVS